MSKNTAVEQFAAEVLKYKNPTNLNGTDYVMIPINKLEYLIEQAKEVEKQQAIEFAYTFSDEIITKEDIESFYEHKYGDNK